jgi:hypothetical protein
VFLSVRKNVIGIGIGSKVGTAPGGVGTGFFVGGLKTIGKNKMGDVVTQG